MLERDRRGRFVSGASGNPKGRPPGILNEATRTAAVLLGGEAGALTRKAVELALGGDIAALRLCLDRIIAPQREPTAAFALPKSRGGEAPPPEAAMAALVRAAAAGEVAPGAAAALAQLLEAEARTRLVAEHRAAERVAARQAEIAVRLELRVCVVMAVHTSDFHVAGRLYDHVLQRRCEAMHQIGGLAQEALAAIPDTPALCAADVAFLKAHPLPLGRAPTHPLTTQMGEAWRRVTEWLDRPGYQDWIEARLAEHAAAHGLGPKA